MVDKLRVLIADDSKTDRLILQSLLKQENYAVYVATDGQEAVEIFQQHCPDIVLIDAIMPNMDGFDAVKQIKQLSSESFVPVIFLTSLTDADSLARCLEVGGDDFLTKPYNHVILKAKIEAFSRMTALYSTVSNQKKEIEKFHQELIAEQHQARKIFDNIAHPGCMHAENISYNQSPMSIFNGDILLAARKPSGSMHIFIGDFTGHSLPAAIGAMPVSEIFYGMTLKGISMEEILKEINSRLHTILPTGTFCCAVCIEVNYELQTGRIWNGGLPDTYLIERDKGIAKSFRSKFLPLGVLGNEQFTSKTEIFSFKNEHSLFLATDGVIESESPAGEMFGTERLLEILGKANNHNIFSEVKQRLAIFSKNQTDDVTFLEVSGVEPKQIEMPADRNFTENKQLQWSIDYNLKADSLRSFDPLPMMVQPLMEVQELRYHRSQIYTVLSELYSNALEHGILKLGSWSTDNPEEFSDYFQKKSTMLSELEHGVIDIKITLTSLFDSVLVEIEVTDSGDGFDTSLLKSKHPNSDIASRGVVLLKELCGEVKYNKKGNHVAVKLFWKKV